ncbi:MAG: alpha-amylase MalA [Halolamina sp.]
MDDPSAAERSHHPGPPQFLAVGESVQVAPRDPDPEETYDWRVVAAPADSAVAFDDDPVQTFEPDVPGRYVLGLDAPDGSHRLTAHVFHGERAVPDTAGQSGSAGVVGAEGEPPGHSGDADEEGSAREEGTATGGRPRIRLGARVEGDHAVVAADVRPHPDDERDPEAFEVVFLPDDRDDLDVADLDVSGREARVPLSAVDGTVRIHAVAVADTYSVADAIELRRAAGDGGIDVSVPDPEAATETAGRGREVLARNVNDPPGWVADATVYEIYVRGFVDADEDQSQFDAIADRLDYLADLGVDTLWLTPVLENDDAPHGYNITDFFAVADDLGDRADYERFVDAAHDRDMRVLFDFVANHSARQHPYYEDAARDPDSEYHDWYEWRGPGRPETYFDWEKIANFDFSTLAVRRHLLDAAAEWASLADGFRCDMAWAVPRSFWQELRDMTKAEDPSFLLLDETIPYIPDFHEGMFDIHFDTTTYFTLRQVGRGDEPAAAILDAVESRTDAGFPDHADFLLYAENHDETRYVVECGDAAARAAAGALFTLPGVPMVYGGQEIGQRGRRDTIAWDHARPAFRDHFRGLLSLRADHPTLGPAGDLRRVPHDGPEETVAFERVGDERLVVVLNFGAEATTVGVDRAVAATNLLTGVDCAAADGLTVADVGVFRIEETDAGTETNSNSE